MNYSEPGFTVGLIGNILTFSGILEKADYTDLDGFLRTVNESFQAEKCIVDLQNLTYINSNGIRSLALFVLGTSKQIEIRLNPEVTKQMQSFRALQHLKSKGVTIIS